MKSVRLDQPMLTAFIKDANDNLWLLAISALAVIFLLIWAISRARRK